VTFLVGSIRSGVCGPALGTWRFFSATMRLVASIRSVRYWFHPVTLLRRSRQFRTFVWEQASPNAVTASCRIAMLDGHCGVEAFGFDLAECAHVECVTNGLVLQGTFA
jgi:hypothetical protein